MCSESHDGVVGKWQPGSQQLVVSVSANSILVFRIVIEFFTFPLASCLNFIATDLFSFSLLVHSIFPHTFDSQLLLQNIFIYYIWLYVHICTYLCYFGFL